MGCAAPLRGWEAGGDCQGSPDSASPAAQSEERSGSIKSSSISSAGVGPAASRKGLPGEHRDAPSPPPLGQLGLRQGELWGSSGGLAGFLLPPSTAVAPRVGESVHGISSACIHGGACLRSGAWDFQCGGSVHMCIGSPVWDACVHGGACVHRISNVLCMCPCACIGLLVWGIQGMGVGDTVHRGVWDLQCGRLGACGCLCA